MSIEDTLFQSLEPLLAYRIHREITALRTYCESEIEVMYGVAATITMGFWFWFEDEPFKLTVASEEAKYGDTQFLLMPQYPWQNYQIDWAWRWRTPRGKSGFVFIECDGHEFHERTKEQAEHDRSKDRAIQKAGIPILRFTGREIFRDAQACVGETFDIIAARFREACDG